LAAVCAVGGMLWLGESSASAGPAEQIGGISYASLPDEVALYLNDMAFVRDTVVLPSENVRVLLPPGTYANTLILTENGERVRNYQIVPQSSETYFDQAAFRYGNMSSVSAVSGAMACVLTWESGSQNSEADTREVTLEYLVPGASWKPSYDMQIVDDQTVNLAFFAEIRDTGLTLDNATVYLVAGRVDLAEQLEQVPMVTANQYVVGYEEPQAVALPQLGVGTVDLQHVYSAGQISAEPGSTVYAELTEATLTARRVMVWNASTEQEADIVFKVLNETDIPLAEGIVRVYQNDLFMGSDFIETTPIGSEGSVTVGALRDVRVHRTESEDYSGKNDQYQHFITLEIMNHSGKDIDLIVVDQRQERSWQFSYSIAPVSEQDNLIRWEVSIPAGQSLTINYDFWKEHY
jgi:hypothetical protein